MVAAADAGAMTAVPRLLDGQVHLWWARRADAEVGLLAVLSPDELQRYDAYRRQADRDRFLVGCSLARMVLAGYLRTVPEAVAVERTCRRCQRPHGKPRLAASQRERLEFSVSHAGARVAVAVCRTGAVGVDLEELDTDLDPGVVASSVLSPGEAAGLGRLDPPRQARAFLQLWTRKEAVLKALGIGLEVSAGDLEVSDPAEPPVVRAWPAGLAPPGPTSMYTLDPGAGYVGALAVLACCDDLIQLDGSTLLAGWLGGSGRRPASTTATEGPR